MRKSISLILALAAAGTISASDDKTDRATLRGVKGVCIVVDVTGPSLEGVPLSKERLHAEVDGRLASAGITLDKNATSCLYLTAELLPALEQSKGKASAKNNRPTGLYALQMNLQFLQTVTLVRDPTIKTYTPTWSLANMATLPADDIASTTRQITVDLTDRFVQAFQSANPK